MQIRSYSSEVAAASSDLPSGAPGYVSLTYAARRFNKSAYQDRGSVSGLRCVLFVDLIFVKRVKAAVPLSAPVDSASRPAC